MEQKKKILIVEDEKNIVDILRFNLQREGYDTLEAYDGAAGLELARTKNPDLVLLDIKEFCDERHRLLTGQSNSATLETAARLEAAGRPMWLRYVLVPGYSDFREDILALCRHFGDYRMVERVEILPYHTFGVHKYAALGQPYALDGVKENTPEQIEAARSLFAEYFPEVRVNR